MTTSWTLRIMPVIYVINCATSLGIRTILPWLMTCYLLRIQGDMLNCQAVAAMWHPRIWSRHTDGPMRTCHNDTRTKWATFADDIFQCVDLNENHLILVQISMQFLTIHLIDNKSTLVIGDGFAPAPNCGKQLPEPIGILWWTSYGATGSRWVISHIINRVSVITFAQL